MPWHCSIFHDLRRMQNSSSLFTFTTRQSWKIPAWHVPARFASLGVARVVRCYVVEKKNVVVFIYLLIINSQFLGKTFDKTWQQKHQSFSKSADILSRIQEKWEGADWWVCWGRFEPGGTSTDCWLAGNTSHIAQIFLHVYALKTRPIPSRLNQTSWVKKGFEDIKKRRI